MMEEDLVEFLKSRDVPEEELERINEDRGRRTCRKAPKKTKTSDGVHDQHQEDGSNEIDISTDAAADVPQENLSRFDEAFPGNLQLSTSSEESETLKDIRLVKVRRVNIMKDSLEIFMDHKILKVALWIQFTNEKAFDDDGVSREAYTAF
ncbi:hypothetical protein SKAU_G00210290 [Synaphobranchus kaupii]|uniref:HECT domain-containing protein n=1 Tax=Synaphobranchus kaupii TaxID=118154 RepID=A0A9Q1ITZ5_SYNKA|nr:hypothetical protein SKAU_G00210290 [Synaphobranchus kaupii]